MTIIDKRGNLKDLHATGENNLFTAVMAGLELKSREERERKEMEERKKAFLASFQTEEFKQQQAAAISEIFAKYKAAI